MAVSIKNEALYAFCRRGRSLARRAFDGGHTRRLRWRRLGAASRFATHGAAIIPGQIAATRLTAVAWQQVPGWQDDSLIGATAALRQNCLRLARQANWARACAAAAQLDDLDVTGARAFF